MDNHQLELAEEMVAQRLVQRVSTADSFVADVVEAVVGLGTAGSSASSSATTYRAPDGSQFARMVDELMGFS